ncbi:YnbE family lipoprotein [Alcanivorax sp. JB21]|uniref:YnbE family lipoprotein n=1 Tax=Alcanivorax limicola TaxID=2874102 RepID=UPI001CC1A4A7|nr:YnbE family lipoprotein [Alcanivorax limicola]MBZ2189536.1 YnbE family lipoprotein [Alcanivorax limicola]
MVWPVLLLWAGLAGVTGLAGCTPRIALEAPKEPITINLNVKIDHEIRLRVERDLDELFSDDSDLF